MFPLVTLARTIHADRVRDLERAARNRRLMAAAADETPSITSTRADPPSPIVRRTARGDSANVPA